MHKEINQKYAIEFAAAKRIEAKALKKTTLQFESKLFQAWCYSALWNYCYIALTSAISYHQQSIIAVTQIQLNVPDVVKSFDELQKAAEECQPVLHSNEKGLPDCETKDAPTNNADMNTVDNNQDNADDNKSKDKPDSDNISGGVSIGVNVIGIGTDISGYFIPAVNVAVKGIQILSILGVATAGV